MSARLALVLVATATFALAGANQAAADLPLCSPATPTHCVVSVTRNGAPVAYPTGAGDPYQVSTVHFADPDGTDHFNFTITRAGPGGGWTLDLTDTWTVVLNTGSVVPEETFARGRNVVVTRGVNASGHNTISFTEQPVRLASDGCDNRGACAAVAALLRPGYLDGWTNDLAYVSDPADRAAMRGFDLVSSTDWVSTPLMLDYATNSIVLDVANAHFEPDGATVFVGHAEFRLPFPMLRRLYDVDDPPSLTPSAFRATAGGGAAPVTTVVVDTAARSVHVTIENLTFSKRRLRIRGDTRPFAPRQLRAARTSSATATLRFLRALPRGSRVRGYSATCRGGGYVARGQSVRSPLRVFGLRPGQRYSCAVRAKSRGGLGRIARAAVRG